MIALMALGIGLLLQTTIAAWCLLTHGQRGILTWSAHPLNATRTALRSGLVTHQAGRCMLAVHQLKSQTDCTAKVFPSDRQDAVWGVHPSVRYSIYIMCGLAVAAVVWPIVIAVLIYTESAYTEFSWLPSNLNAVSLGLSISAGNDLSHDYYSFTTQLILGILFITGVQSLQTTGLHMTELLVNLSRDEAAWRQATSTVGAAVSDKSSSLYAAATSWESVVLFIAKAVLHWIIGQSLFAQVAKVTIGGEQDEGRWAMWFIVSWSRLIVYAICAVFTAAFGIFLALRKPKGPQPAAWGHLQTLADLVDDWKTDEKSRFWWGDKTSDVANTICRHAGTSDKKEKLNEISMYYPYA